MPDYIYVIAGTLVIVALLYLLRNVFKRIYLAIKFVIFPNKYDVVKKDLPMKFAPLVLLSGWFTQISAKAIAYLVIFAIVGTVCFGLYKKITAATYSNDYKNNIHGNQAVAVDESQTVIAPEDTLLIGIKIFGLKLGISAQETPKVPAKITNNGQTVTVTKPVPVSLVIANSTVPVVKPVVKKANIFIRIAQATGIAAVVIVGVHYIVKIFKKQPAKPSGV